jgi:importin subunit alpha-1
MFLADGCPLVAHQYRKCHSHHRVAYTGDCSVLWFADILQAGGTSHHTGVVVEAGAIPLFCRFLTCSDAMLVEQAIWAVGNIAGDSVLHRDGVLASGCMALLLAAMDSLGVGQLSLLRIATWALSIFCRGKPPPDLDLVMPALPTIARLILSEDQEILSDACWATSYISDGDEKRIEAVLAHVPLDHLVELLSSEHESILTPALRIFGNIVTGNDDQTDRVIQCGILPHLRRMLFHHKKSLRKEACWSLSNMTAGTDFQVAAVIACDIIPPIVNLLSVCSSRYLSAVLYTINTDFLYQVDDFEVQKEAAWCISNATCSSDPTHIEHLVQCQCLRPMVELLLKGDLRTSKVGIIGVCGARGYRAGNFSRGLTPLRAPGPFDSHSQHTPLRTVEARRCREQPLHPRVRAVRRN